MGTFHLSCGEYAILPLDLITILGLRFEGELVLTEFVGVADECTLLGIDYPHTTVTNRFFGPTLKPKICLLQQKMIIPRKKGARWCGFQEILLLLHWFLSIWKQHISADL